MTPGAREPIVLLTGFGPFGGDARNPSGEAVAALDGERIAGHRIVARVLPVGFGTARQALLGALRATRPALVLCTGLAASRDAISLERVAINVDDARIPDNAGRQPIDAPVVAGAPAAYFSTLPIKSMALALARAGIRAEVSQTAGTFVCNHVFYALMHALRRRPGVRGGFVHVPHASATNPGASLPASEIVDALRICVRTAASVHDDARVAAGAID